MNVKEFIVCYTLDHDIVTEKLIKEIDVKKEDVEQEVIEKLERNKSINVKNGQGNYRINSSLVRYVRIVSEKILIK
ncbi:hypothetical protein [Neobacillus niacini]|uniref:hypothetical protein n=1 Tax=Neobacillus niacini TaxID=86668 RepID=UPI0028542C74|nr:hypothetical protein [Neobacillus niacini]MDR7000215.1 uncharacterized protein YjhX (UPF0386 family) [Neobacillus niacini]